MMDAIDLLTRHGYVVVFAWVFAEQIGLPIPSTIVLLAAGAVAATGGPSLSGLILVGLLASTLSDVIWYGIGRRRGLKVLGFLCRVSLEPDSCVRRTEQRFARNRVNTLLIAKFLPGLNIAAPPLAGMFRMGFWKFLLFDSLGGLLWVGSSVLLGYLFARQLDDLLLWSRQLGLGLGVLLGLAVLTYVTWKYIQRRRFIRGLRVSTISPDDLKQKLENGEPVFIVDLRHAMDLVADPVRLPGALQVKPSDLTAGGLELPRDREIVLYCT